MSNPSAVPVTSENRNVLATVRFRRSIMMMQRFMEEVDRLGIVYMKPDQYPLRNHFTPIDKDFGCCLYAREVIINTGHIIMGHIHNRPHINFLMSGKMLVATEMGREYQEAPFIAVYPKAGIKKMIYVKDEVTLVTVMLSRHSGNENLAAAERDVFAENYKDLGLASSIDEFYELEKQLWQA